MSEWRETTLGEIATLNYGKALKVEDRESGEVAVYSSAGITGWHNKPIVKGKGIIVGRKGTVGSVYYADMPFYCIDTAYYIKEDDNKYDLKLLYYYLKYLRLDRLNEDSAVPGLNRDNAYLQDIYLPDDIPEQKRISRILSVLDDKIDLLRRQNETLEAIAQTLFKRWFVKFEFPDERGRPYKSSGGKMVSSELGVIPDGWSEKCFYELGAYINGGAFKQEDFSQHNAGLPIIKIVELKYGITNQTKYTEKQVTDKIIINDNDILFSWSGSPETSIDIFVWNLGRGVLNQHTFKVIPNKSIEKSWLYNLLKFYKPLFIRIAKQKQTTGLGHVTVSDLRENKVVFPNNKILTKSNLIADPIFKKYYLNLKEISTVSKLRDILLPKLMSGQIRVK